MFADASTILRAVAADFFFNCWYLEIPTDNRIRHIPRCVHYHAQGFRLERSRIYILEVEAVPRVVFRKSRLVWVLSYIYKKFVACREF
jgi:hypothetical protein